ncbi:hypothetical protein BS47DRAFT_398779 [Hydnum rufescens UP504]|uniref:Autophagy-related protein 29 n=1 Tax=Hydnum rufescens UP504 TaxID=1448309 RepID=A0A9P6BAQ7_9AGAM|nr:hypothetical protein BS47DRAFT_398779 [Hydnum rufescens UP504]
MSTTPIVIVRLPFDRPQEGGTSDPAPIDWTPEKERLLWQQLSSSRTVEDADVDWQALATRLDTPLPYLLYKTQARYEQDLRKIHEIKPIVSTTALPPSSNDPRPRLPSLSRRTSSRAESSTSVPHSSSPRMVEKPLLSNLSASRLHTPLVALRFPQVPRGSSDRIMEAMEATSSSSSESAQSDEDEAERAKLEQESIVKRLKELERLMSTETPGFARPANRPAVRNAGRGGHRQLHSYTIPSPADQMSDVPESAREEEPDSPPTTDASSRRTSRFARGVIPSIPSSSSQSPARSPNGAPLLPNARHKAMPARLENALRGGQSESSQGSQASSFSDISGKCDFLQKFMRPAVEHVVASDASISASALEEALQSRAGGTSRLSMFARSHFSPR